MVKRFIKLNFLVLLLGSFCVAAQPSVWQQNIHKLQVADRIVSGNVIFSDEDIFKTAKVKTVVGRHLDEKILQDDLKRIIATGYYSEVDVDFELYDNGVRVVFIVEENPVVNKITVLGNRSLPPELFDEYLGSKQDDILNYSLLRSDVDFINRAYRKLGYDLSSVQSVEDNDHNELLFFIEEPFINRIIVTGNNFTDEMLIKRELSINEGDIYNAKEIDRSRNRIFGLGYFSQVYLPEVLPTQEPGAVDLRIRVREKQKNNVNLGLGVTSREQFAFGQLSLLNIFNTGEQLYFNFQTGQEFREEEVLPKTSYRLRYYNPWIFHRNVSLGYTRYLNMRYESVRSDSIDANYLSVRRDGFSTDLGVDLPWGRAYRLVLGYKDESVAENSFTPRVAYYNKSLSGTYIYNNLESLAGSSIVVEGDYLRLKLERGGELELFPSAFLGYAAVDFSRVEWQYSRFLPLTQDNNIVVFSYRSAVYDKIDQVVVLEGDEYSVGGGNSVRGYADVSPFAIGPKMIVMSMEYRYIFNEYWQGIVFYDWGNAFLNTSVPLSDFKSGHGVGVRFNSFVGPIRFDLGKGEQYWFLHFGLGDSF